ncbi:MAG: 50S ribosomal protein L10 [Defluviitaleaceae bacterium]|nr:50S ribosomal protein L10 [Defluviitaleaceae bacterium]
MTTVSANLEQNRKAKESVVTEIKERLSRAKSVVLVDARGLTVAEDTNLRKSLRKVGNIDYKVYKNSMTAFAIEGTDFAGLKEYLAGPTAIAFSYEDATAAAAQISKHLKAMPSLEFKASAMDGEVYDAAKTKAIADIPSREVLISKLLGSLKSPLSSFARVINAIAEKSPEEAAAAVAAPAEAPAAEAAPVEEVATAEAAPAEEPAAEAPAEEPVAEAPAEEPEAPAAE